MNNHCGFCTQTIQGNKKKYCNNICKRKKELFIRRQKYKTNQKYRISELNRVKSEWDNLPEESKKKENKQKDYGKTQIEPEEESFGFSGIAKIELKKIQIQKEEKKEETPPEELLNLQENIKKGILQSDNYLKNATEQMLSFLGGLHDKHKEIENNHINTHMINTAVNCVNQIQKLMRVRLDAAKIVFQYMGENKSNEKR